MVATRPLDLPQILDSHPIPNGHGVAVCLSMATSSADTGIDEYLRDRLMPVEGAIPHLPGIEMYGNSIPVKTVGGDLFEHINAYAFLALC